MWAFNSDFLTSSLHPRGTPLYTITSGGVLMHVISVDFGRHNLCPGYPRAVIPEERYSPKCLLRVCGLQSSNPFPVLTSKYVIFDTLFQTWLKWTVLLNTQTRGKEWDAGGCIRRSFLPPLHGFQNKIKTKAQIRYIGTPPYPRYYAHIFCPGEMPV